MNKKIILILLLFFITLIANASRLKRGFQALDIYNYFEAKTLFEKTKKRHKVPSAYGLSIIYQRKDNPFFNLDSAYNNIILAVDNFSDLKEKKKIKYNKYGVDSLRIIRQRDLISKDLYNRALDVNSIFGFQDFIDKNNWSPNVDNAIALRDSLFYFEMNAIGTSESYSRFLNTYPKSIYSNQAQNRYDKQFYVEKTSNNHLISYVDFLNVAPTSPFVTDAEDRIYELSTTTKTTVAYENFIKDYPTNRNVNLAWKMLYETSLQQNYSRKEIESFLAKYPDYPFKSGAKEELEMEGIEFLPIRMNDDWGFLSENNNYYIAPKYDYVEAFSEGLAIVSKDSKVGFISKTGEQKIDLKFDDAYSFQNGYAVVELNEKFGLINRSGEYVVSPEYEDLGNIIEGFCFFEKNEAGYGYFDRKGLVRLKPDYTDAGNFNNGIAIVSKNNNYGVIDNFGTTFIPFKYEEIHKLDSSNFAVKVEGKWGVLNLDHDTILPFNYSFIGYLDSSFLMVEKDFKFNFWDRNNNSILSEIWFENYPEYRELGKFNNGFAKVKTDEGYNFISQKGQLLLPKSYSNLGEYNVNIAFQKEDKWGYINKLGKVIIEPKYERAQSFGAEGGIVDLFPLKGIVDVNGNLLLDIYYEDFVPLNDTLYIVKSRGRYGLISTQKDTIVDIKYKLIEPYSNSVVKIVNEDSQWYYNFVTNKWIKREE